MKAILIFVLSFTIFSCSPHERKYNKRSWEIKTKERELEYLKELFQFREIISQKRQIEILDSLISDFNKTVDVHTLSTP